jgi:hypothetical protein
MVQQLQEGGDKKQVSRFNKVVTGLDTIIEKEKVLTAKLQHDIKALKLAHRIALLEAKSGMREKIHEVQMKKKKKTVAKPKTRVVRVVKTHAPRVGDAAALVFGSTVTRAERLAAVAFIEKNRASRGAARMKRLKIPVSDANLERVKAELSTLPSNDIVERAVLADTSKVDTEMVSSESGSD